MRTPEPLHHVHREARNKTRSREEHLREFTNVLDGALSAPTAMSFVYVGATGDDPTHAVARFRGLEDSAHSPALGVALLASTIAGSMSRDELMRLFAEVMAQMDQRGWPAGRS